MSPAPSYSVRPTCNSFSRSAALLPLPETTPLDPGLAFCAVPRGIVEVGAAVLALPAAGFVTGLVISGAMLILPFPLPATEALEDGLVTLGGFDAAFVTVKGRSGSGFREDLALDVAVERETVNAGLSLVVMVVEGRPVLAFVEADKGGFDDVDGRGFVAVDAARLSFEITGLAGDGAVLVLSVGGDDGAEARGVE